MTDNKMQILIVDDDTNKSAKVQNTVEDAIFSDNYEVQHAVTACEAYKLLQCKQYDLLILDVNIPIRTGDTVPNRNGGVMLLHKLTGDPSIRRPTHIIGLTGYDDILAEHSSEFIKRAWHLIKYENDSQVWSEMIKEKINHIIACNVKQNEKIRILFLAADPASYSERGLSIDREVREICDQIQKSKYRNVLQLTSRWAVRANDILHVLNEEDFDIVHFSGHGCSSGQLVVLGPNDSSSPIDLHALEKLFEVMKGKIRLVLLNACYSKAQAVAITNHINCCIGMNDSIEDAAAINFAAAFYSAIGFGKSVRNAFDQAIVALMSQGIPGKDIPELLLHTGCDPDKIVFCQ